jgi:Flp pilus assembly protein TadD
MACRGLEQRPDHRGLRIARGRCLLHKQLPEDALVEFRAALQARHDITAFNGAVMACIQARKHKEALMHARTAARVLPNAASTACLVGLVHLQAPNAAPKLAEMHLRRALKLDPGHREAAAALVSVLLHNKQGAEAATVVLDQITRQPTDTLYMQLGDIYRYGTVTLVPRTCHFACACCSAQA